MYIDRDFQLKNRVFLACAVLATHSVQGMDFSRKASLGTAIKPAAVFVKPGQPVRSNSYYPTPAQQKSMASSTQKMGLPPTFDPELQKMINPIKRNQRSQPSTSFTNGRFIVALKPLTMAQYGHALRYAQLLKEFNIEQLVHAALVPSAPASFSEGPANTPLLTSPISAFKSLKGSINQSPSAQS